MCRFLPSNFAALPISNFSRCAKKSVYNPYCWGKFWLVRPFLTNLVPDFSHSSSSASVGKRLAMSQIPAHVHTLPSTDWKFQCWLVNIAVAPPLEWPIRWMRYQVRCVSSKWPIRLSVSDTSNEYVFCSIAFTWSLTWTLNNIDKVSADPKVAKIVTKYILLTHFGLFGVRVVFKKITFRTQINF